MERARTASETARCVYSGSADHPLYVDRVVPEVPRAGAASVVMLHGGGHTGACYLATPDGRPGWAEAFAAAGHTVYVPDWPGHGRSPMRPDFARLSIHDIAASLLVLVEAVGPVILVAHSAGGPLAWWLAERRPDLVCAVVGLAPGGPSNLLPALPEDPAELAARDDAATLGHPICVPETAPVWFDPAFVAAYWANADRFPRQALERYRRAIVPESARVLNERFNIGGRGLAIADPAALRDCPILILTGDQDPRHPRALDAATAAYLGAEFVWLPDRGIHGNGHMLMIEDNSEALAAFALAWLRERGL